MGKLTYKACGVDIKKAERFIKGIEVNRGIRVPAFSSLFDLGRFMKKYESPYLVASTDGVGTKLKIAQEVDIHSTVGIDLVAMNVNDIVCVGAKPLFFLDYIACGKLDMDKLTQVMKGIKYGLKESDCILIGGETAQMPAMYEENEYDLAGFCVGIVDKKNIVDGRNIKEGDVLIGLASNGLHSNGFSLVRRVFTQKEIKTYANELLKPTRIYTRYILDLLESFGYDKKIVKGIAHITGGAFYHKATKILPKGLCMLIRKDSWPIPKIFKLIQEKASIDNKHMYSVFNMGIGMIVVVSKYKVKDVFDILHNRVDVYLIGEIIKSKEQVKIV
ncbi:MAG: phosphoribosylformylglycinamidine cyclo-ligase [Candidatus Omnitrophica bacterium]|nr:phosphoribosylformylglycinamidine cyclo-ligase [Candidatus Omnitrophota bacterium]